jgi:hypothetical protein
LVNPIRALLVFRALRVPRESKVSRVHKDVRASKAFRVFKELRGLRANKEFRVYKVFRVFKELRGLRANKEFRVYKELRGLRANKEFRVYKVSRVYKVHMPITSFLMEVFQMDHRASMETFGTHTNNSIVCVFRSRTVRPGGR